MKRGTSKSGHDSTLETAQTAIWKGDFGREYTDRSTLDIGALDDLYRKNYGVSRTEINKSFLLDIPKDASLLEVGSNTGNQLAMLRGMGWTNLSGLELQPYAFEIARRRLPDVSFEIGSALSLPWTDSTFDVVFTSGVLIHISPQDLPRALHEIHRTSRRYIWGVEYYSPEVTEVTYRSHSGLLWKMDFARRYLECFQDLELVKEQHLAYLQSENVDTVFLLKKRE
jgi:pseudaminic acid biosynthesis-associated methylase